MKIIILRNFSNTSIFQFAAIIILFLMMFSAISSAESSFKYEKEARFLYNMGLFDGTSKVQFNPDLGLTLDRTTGVALIVKILGKKAEADAMDVSEAEGILNKYKDSSLLKQDWQKKFMAYAVKTGMVKGVSEASLGALDNIQGTHLATIILLNLGHEVANYKESLKNLMEKGGLSESQVIEFNKTVLTRDDLVGIGFGALNAVDSEGLKLVQGLTMRKAVRTDAAREAGFVIGSSLDMMPFKISSIRPNNEQIGVPIDSNIIIKLLKPVDKNTVNKNNINVRDSDGDSIKGEFSYGIHDDEVIFKPTSLLRNSTKYTITLEKIKDTYGNIIDNTRTTFTTTENQVNVASVRFYDKAWNPDDNAGNDVILTSKTVEIAKSVVGDAYSMKTPEIAINFSDKVDMSSIQTGAAKLVNFTKEKTFVLDIIEIKPTMISISIPEGELETNSGYELVIDGICDTKHKAIPTHRVKFSIGDTWKPRITKGPSAKDVDVRGSIAEGFKFEINFGRKVLANSVFLTNIYIQEFGNKNIVDANLDFNDNTNTAVLTPKYDLRKDTKYSLIVRDIIDTRGIKCQDILEDDWYFITSK